MFSFWSITTDYRFITFCIVRIEIQKLLRLICSSWSSNKIKNTDVCIKLTLSMEKYTIIAIHANDPIPFVYLAVGQFLAINNLQKACLLKITIPK